MNAHVLASSTAERPAERTRRQEVVESSRAVWLLAGPLLLATLIAAPSPAHAQGNERSQEARHEAECRLAAQVLTRGQPANKRAWALSKIKTCGARGGRALADALEDHRSAERRSASQEEIVEAASEIVDRELFRTALDIATDRSASPVGRIQAIRVLYQQITPGGSPPFKAFVAPGAGLTRTPPSTEPAIDTPLAEDALERLVRALRRVERTAVSEDVRIAADRVAGAAEFDRTVKQFCGEDVTLECLEELRQKRRSAPIGADTSSGEGPGP